MAKAMLLEEKKESTGSLRACTRKGELPTILAISGLAYYFAGNGALPAADTAVCPENSFSAFLLRSYFLSDNDQRSPKSAVQTVLFSYTC